MVDAADLSLLDENLPDPPLSVSSVMFSFTDKESTDSTKQNRRCFMAGLCKGIHDLQAEWDSVPIDMPFDPSVPVPGTAAVLRYYENPGTVYQKRSTGKSPVLVQGGDFCFIPVLESFIRVVIAHGLVGDKPFASIWHQLSNKSLPCVMYTNPDREIVLQIISINMWRSKTGKAKEDKYSGMDTEVLHFLKLMAPLSSKLDRWGIKMAQLYIDFVRWFGEMTAVSCWEKKTNFDEAQFRYLMRMSALITGVSVSEETMNDIYSRSPSKGKK
jgi:hypothetical protein